MAKVIPYTEDRVPPSGYILAEDTGGNRFWISPDDIDCAERPKRSELSQQQRQRVRHVADVLFEVDSTPLNEWIESLEGELDPEREIKLWEIIVEIYNREIAKPRNADLLERVLLYKILVQCSFSSDIDHVLGAVPDAKAMPQLDRIVNRFREALPNNWRFRVN